MNRHLLSLGEAEELREAVLGAKRLSTAQKVQLLLHVAAYNKDVLPLLDVVRLLSE